MKDQNLFLPLLLCPSLLFSQELQSNEKIEDVVVTAQYREKNLKDVPISLIAVDNKTLENLSIEQMADLQFSAPNFSMAESGVGTNVFIRGIGSGNNQGFEQSVGVFVDGIHHGRAQQARAPFFDLQRVEILRGPQSILFGKNSIAGALNLTTARPTENFEGQFSINHGFTFEETESSIILSGPISDKFRYRIAGRHNDTGGYIENLTLNRDEPQQRDFTLRTTFEYDFSDNFMATLKLEKGQFNVVGRNIEINGEQPSDSGLLYSEILTQTYNQDISVLNNHIDGKRSSNGDFSNNSQFEAILSLDWQLENHSLSSITGISNFSFDDLCDCDFTGAEVLSLALTEEFDQFSQEIRLASTSTNTIDYIVGGFYQTSKHDYRDILSFSQNSILVNVLNNSSDGLGDLFSNTATPRVALVDTTIFSAFAQFDWHINDTMTLQFGSRLTHESKDGFRNITITAADGSPLPDSQSAVVDLYGSIFDLSASNASSDIHDSLGKHPVSGKRSETVFTPDLKFIWNITGDTLLYSSVGKGNKSGGFDFKSNNRGVFSTMEESFQFENEVALSYEAGGKTSFANGMAEVNYTAYYTQYKDLQVSIFDGALGFNVGNAAEALLKGIELDGRWQATNSLTVRGSLALNDFQFKNYTNGRCNFGQQPNGPQIDDGFCDYSGKTNQLVSDWPGTLNLIHTHELNNGLELNTLFNVFFTDDYHTSASLDPALIQQAYANVNFRIGLSNTIKGWDIALLGKNLTDETIVLFGGDAPLSGSVFGAIAKYNFLAKGRSIALQFKKTF